VCTACVIAVAKWSKPYNIFSRPFGINTQHCKELVTLGWPISIQVSGELSAMTIATYFIGWFGASALAAAQITFQFVVIVVMIIMGLSQGVSILVSHAYGKKNRAEIKKIAFSGMLLSGVVTCMLAIGFLIFPQTLIDFYLRVDHPVHNELVHIATYFMMIAVVGMAFDGVRNVLTSTLRAMHDPKIPMQIGVFCLWLIGLPCAYIVGELLHGGAIGIRVGWVFGIIIATLWLVYRAHHKLR
jgi:multidrug resistance protein, MATE family